MEVLQEALGPNHPDTLICVHNLGVLLQVQGHFSEAEPLLRRAMDGCERAFGPGHHDTFTSAKNLVTLLGQQGLQDSGSMLAEQRTHLTGSDEHSSSTTASADLSLEVRNGSTGSLRGALESYVSEVTPFAQHVRSQNPSVGEMGTVSIENAAQQRVALVTSGLGDSFSESASYENSLSPQPSYNGEVLAIAPECRRLEVYKSDKLKPVLDPMVLACVRNQ